MTRSRLVLASVGALVLSVLAPIACGGGSSDSNSAATGPGAGGSSGGSGASAGGSSAGTTGQGASAGASTGGASAGGSSAGGATSGASGAAGVGGNLVGVDGGMCGTTACTDCLDNDGDGLVDGFDPDCTGYLDNDEGSFATGIPGDNIDPCKQDCFFDGNSGQGDDKCEWDLACDPKSPGAKLGCPYDPNKKNCKTTQTAECIKNCQKLVPNGCDCFGCCAFGTKTVLLLPTCNSTVLDDAVKCPPCTQVTDCVNPCETCELCLGKNELPPECNPGTGGSSGAGGSSTAGAGGSTAGAGGSTTAGAGGTGPLPVCPPGVTPCTPAQPCGPGAYCLTGCCEIVPK